MWLRWRSPSTPALLPPSGRGRKRPSPPLGPPAKRGKKKKKQKKEGALGANRLDAPPPTSAANAPARAPIRGRRVRALTRRDLAVSPDAVLPAPPGRVQSFWSTSTRWRSEPVPFHRDCRAERWRQNRTLSRRCAWVRGEPSARRKRLGCRRDGRCDLCRTAASRAAQHRLKVALTLATAPPDRSVAFKITRAEIESVVADRTRRRNPTYRVKNVAQCARRAKNFPAAFSEPRAAPIFLIG